MIKIEYARARMVIIAVLVGFAYSTLMANEPICVEKDIEYLEKRLNVLPLYKLDSPNELVIRCWTVPTGDEARFKEAAIFCVTFRIPLTDGIVPNRVMLGRISGRNGDLHFKKIFKNRKSDKNCIEINTTISADRIADLVKSMEETEVFRLPKYFGADKWSKFSNVGFGGLRVILQRRVFGDETTIDRWNGKGGVAEFVDAVSNIIDENRDLNSRMKEAIKKMNIEESITPGR